MRAFGGSNFLIVERRVHRMPRQAGAFDARWKVAHARKDRQATQMMRRCFFIQLARHHPVKLIEKSFGVLPGFSLNGLRHHARRRLRDGAARAFKADVTDDFIFKLHVDRQLIAAERIVSFGAPVSRFQFMEITRLLVVIENDLLVKLA